MRTLLIFILLVLAGVALAEPKTDKAALPTGKWEKKAENNVEIHFQFEKNTLTFTLSAGAVGCELEAKTVQGKDGLIECETTKYTKIGDFPIEKEKGYKFNFRIKTAGKTATVSDFDGKDVDEHAKKLIEGEYRAVK